MRFAVIGVDHPHILEMTQGLIDAGGEFAGWHSIRDSRVSKLYADRFGEMAAAESEQRLLDDQSIDLIMTAAIPNERARIAVKAMAHGKHVVSDKPAAVNREDLDELQTACAAYNKRLTTVFAERMNQPAMWTAKKLIEEGLIGDVIHTVGLAPHKLNASIRPDWFFDSSKNGSVFADIASHEIDQFIWLTGSKTVNVASASSSNVGNPRLNGFCDMAQIQLVGENASGYIKVDWLSPDGLPTWGDVRSFIFGTQGQIEVRKNIDLAGNPGSSHVFVVGKDEPRHIDCSGDTSPFYKMLIDDLRTGSESATSNAHCLLVNKLSLDCEKLAN